MPTIGRPENLASLSRRKKIAMYRDSKEKKEKKVESGDREFANYLNKMTGRKEIDNGVVYLDGKKHNVMGKDEFMTLFTHQLQNQDPMNPMEQDKFAGQLAQYAQLEQLVNMNKMMEGQNKNVDTDKKVMAANFLGKEITTNGSSVDFKGNGTQADMMFHLDRNAAQVVVRVFDEQGQTVAEVSGQNLASGTNTLKWDGVMLDKGIAAAGKYNIVASAWDENANPVTVKTKVRGKVNAVSFEKGELVLTVGSRKVFVRDVDSFAMPVAEKQEQTLPSKNAALQHFEKSKNMVN